MLYIYITFSLVFDDRFCDEHDLRSSRWQIMWCTWSQEPFTADYVKNMITDISWDSIGFRVFAGEPKFQQPLTAQGLGRRSRPLGPHMHGSWCEKAWLSVLDSTARRPGELDALRSATFTALDETLLLALASSYSSYSILHIPFFIFHIPICFF